MGAITGLLGFIPGWVWALITAGAIATSCTQGVRLDHEKAKHAETRMQYANYKSEVESQIRKASEEARAKEQELTDAATKAQAQAHALRDQLDLDRVASGVASQRLRDSAATAALIARSQCANSTSAAVSETAADSARVLANVLAELDERAGALADLADRSRAAGLTCEAIYDAAVKATQ